MAYPDIEDGPIKLCRSEVRKACCNEAKVTVKGKPMCKKCAELTRKRGG